MDPILSILIGIGLAAACGFRIFVPLLVMSIASASGHLALAPSFQWIGSQGALITFSVATVLEIAAYYIPFLDHFLDTIATPAAVVAGTIVTASMVSNVDPFLRWTLAVIAGGGVAALVQGSTVLARVASTATTGGLGNSVVASAELGLAAFMSVLAVLVPLAAILLLGVVGVGIGAGVRRKFRKSPVTPACEVMAIEAPPILEEESRTPHLLSR